MSASSAEFWRATNLSSNPQEINLEIIPLEKNKQ
jgi:hypothetical protein